MAFFPFGCLFTGRNPGKIRFINDSKATNMVSASYGLSKVKQDSTTDDTKIYWLCGGQLKTNDPMEVLRPNSNSVAKAFAFGSGARQMEDFLKDESVSVEVFPSLTSAVKRAIDEAVEFVESAENQKVIILLSPGGASFDEFLNFEERGDIFKSVCDNFLKHERLSE